MKNTLRVDVTTWKDRPDSAGWWWWKPEYAAHAAKAVSVRVEDNSAGGRICRDLKMGGHAYCGFPEWSGLWRRLT
jgi:hypothetical protein